MKKGLSLILVLVLALSIMVPLTSVAEGNEVKKIAFCFQDLETEFWVAGYKAITSTLREQGIEVLEYNANEDANKQLEQVNDAIAQGVDGIIIIPQDGESAVTIVKTCNRAGVPIAVFNRPPSVQSVNAIVVVADNYSISYDAATYMFEQARIRFDETGEKVIAIHMVGDLGDPNAIQRADGFKKVAEENADIVEAIVEVPTKWDANTALANLKSATQANPGFNMLFCGSDFLYPQIQSVLEPLGKWVKIGEENHVIMGAVDGDATAGRLMDEGYVDATAVQDLYFEATACMESLIEAVKEGETSPSMWIFDPGFALTQGNMAERRNDMWGNK
jgi:inositol transport system substrate-binding protein